MLACHDGPMCGRYAVTKDPATLATEFDAVDGTGGEAPGADYNVAPTKPVLTVVDRGERTIRVMRWGLVPHWAKDRSVGAKMINARTETAATKPAYRTAIAKRRCLLPADGWYEWQRQPSGGDGRGGKRPFFMTPGDGSSLAIAGVWSVWHDPAAGPDEFPLISTAVLTTAAVGPLAEIHHRMPLILPADAWHRWLDPTVEEVSGLLAPPAEDLVARLELRPVSSAVNSVRNNGPELVAAIAADVPDLDAPAEQPALFDTPARQ